MLDNMIMMFDSNLWSLCSSSAAVITARRIQILNLKIRDHVLFFYVDNIICNKKQLIIGYNMYYTL